MLFCMWLGILCTVDQVELCPKPDITAYQLALMLRGVRDADLFKRHPELLRHTSEPGKCIMKGTE